MLLYMLPLYSGVQAIAMWETAELFECGDVECSCCFVLYCKVYLNNKRSTLASINPLPDFNQHSFYVRKTVLIANLI